MTFQEKAHELETQGKFLDAIKYYLSSIAELKDSEFEEKELHMAKIFYRTAACFTELGEYHKAIKCYDDSIKCISSSNAETKEIFRHTANCCADISACLISLADRDFEKNLENAVKFLDKSIDFTRKRVSLEDEVIQKFVQERAIIYNNYKAIIFLLLGKMEKAANLVYESSQELGSLGVSGLGADLTQFTESLLEGNPSKAKDLLISSIEANSTRLSFAGPSLRANILSLFHKAIGLQISEERIHLQKSAIKEKGKVLLKQCTYRNMMLHMLHYARHGVSQSNWVETAGWIIGKIEDDDVVCMDAFPIMTGSAVEFEFKEEHYIKAAAIDNELFERDEGEFIVGWYHSHPGLGLFLSHTDIMNHLGFQSANPKAIALVFDHMKYSEEEKNFGFEIFRLNDPNLGPSSDYHKLEFAIEGLENQFTSNISDWILNFSSELNRLVQKSSKLKILEISEKLNYSEHLLREIITELKTGGYLRNLFYDIKNDQVIDEQGIREIIIQMVNENEDGILPFHEIYKRVAITETQVILLFEVMIRLDLISGVIRKSSSDFLKT